MRPEKDPSDFAQLLTFIEEARQGRDLAFQILNRINDGFVALDKEWRYVYLNQRAAGMLQRKSPEDLLGKHIWTEYPEGIGQPFYQAYYRAMETQEPQFLEENYQPWDLWFENRIYPSPEGISIFFTEITERKRVEAALRKSESELRAITVHAPDYIIQIDREGRITYVNRVENGIRLAEVLGQTWIRLVHEADRSEAQKAFDATLCGKGVTEFEVRGPGAHGRESWFRCRLSPVMVEGEVQSLILFCSDITEQKIAAEEKIRLEASLQHSLKLESLGRLASGVAHDMNNVLGAILGLASATQVNEPTLDVKSAMDTIIKACDRGRQMVKGLLDFSRKELLERRVLNLNSLIEEEVKLLAHTTLQKVCLVLDLAPNLRPVMGDPGSLGQALMNLCVNAVDAMPQGGRLQIKTANDGDEVWIEVRDTGEGMAPEVLEKALDPFFTTKAPGAGTGLGLPSVFGILKAHGGSMNIQSQPGQGTCIRLRLPACGEGGCLEAHLEPERSVLSEGFPQRLLLIDDDELIRSSMGVLFDVLGLEAAMADCGESALSKVREGFMPDCVILDMNMPGMGGPETLVQLRHLLPEVPVLLATGRADQSAWDLASAHPRVSLLAKPFALEELRSRLSAIQAGRR